MVFPWMSTNAWLNFLSMHLKSLIHKSERRKKVVTNFLSCFQGSVCSIFAVEIGHVAVSSVLWHIGRFILDKKVTGGVIIRDSAVSALSERNLRQKIINTGRSYNQTQTGRSPPATPCWVSSFTFQIYSESRTQRTQIWVSFPVQSPRAAS